MADVLIDEALGGFTKTCRIGKLGLHANHNFSITNYGAILKKKKKLPFN